MLTYLEALATPLVRTISKQGDCWFYYHGVCVQKGKFEPDSLPVFAWEFDPLAPDLTCSRGTFLCDHCDEDLQGPPT